jgi:hypothetical protein
MGTIDARPNIACPDVHRWVARTLDPTYKKRLGNTRWTGMTVLYIDRDIIAAYGR